MLSLLLASLLLLVVVSSAIVEGLTLRSHKSAALTRRLRRSPQREITPITELLKDHSISAEDVPTMQGIPKIVDWRKHGYVQGPINEGDCAGGGMADGEVAVMASILAIKNQAPPAVPLSYQELLDCAISCTTGEPAGDGFEWMLNHNHGTIATNASYTSGPTGPNKCNPSSGTVGATLKKVHSLAKDEKEMAFAVALWGPIIIDLDATGLQLYTGNPKVLTHCPADLIDDVATLVGYNLDASPPYWILRNVWGTEWGVGGFAYLSFGNNSCGLTANPIIPELKF